MLDVYTRECLALLADRSLTGAKVAAALTAVLTTRPQPEAITVDNGTEFVSWAMDAWSFHRRDVRSADRGRGIDRVNTRHQAEWLSLARVSGPFPSQPVLMEVFNI